jgi:hypothetical protein
VKYMLLITEPATREPAGDLDREMSEGYMKFTQSIVESGELVAGDRLQGIDTATTVRVRNGQRTTTDGPFAETKEVLGGYYIVDCKDLDRALDLAAEIPGAATSSVEVRPIFEFGG